MSRRTTMRDERASLLPPQQFTTTCDRCQVENVSGNPALPRGWRIVRAGVRCPDCAPVDPEGRTNG